MMRRRFGLMMGALALLAAGAIMGGECGFSGDFDDDDGFGFEVDDDGFSFDKAINDVSALPADRTVWTA